MVSFTIKDHKPVDIEGGYPFRPLANINGSTLDGVDWLVAKILNQGIRLVAYNVWNAQQVMQEIPRINSIPVEGGCRRRVISLDVIGLYPSIPIWEGVNKVGRFICDNNHRINFFGITNEKFVELLRLLAHNYIVKFGGIIYKQTKGVAMGARFACSFAVVYMYIIEDQFIRDWYAQQLNNLKLLYYGRYIDDILLVVDDRGDSLNHIF